MNGPTRIIMIVAAVLLSLVFLSLYSSFGGFFTGQANTETTLVSEGKSISVSFSPTAIDSHHHTMTKVYKQFTVDVLSSVDGPLPWYIVVPFVQNGTYNLQTTIPSRDQNATVLNANPVELKQEYIPQTGQYYSFHLTGYNVTNMEVLNLTANMYKGESIVLWIFTEYQGKFYRLAITYLTPNDMSVYPNQATEGLELCTNIYTVIQTVGQEAQVMTEGTSYDLPNGSIIIVPTTGVLPKLAEGPLTFTLPAGTVIQPKGEQAVQLQGESTLNLEGNLIEEKCLYDSYLPFSSFFTGYQSDNDNIGTTIADPNPMLQSQTLSQWFIASGNLAPLGIVGGNSTPQANQVCITNYPPIGGYLVWTGDAGLIVGQGLQDVQPPKGNAGPHSNPPPPGQGSNFYVGFTVHLANNEWATIVSTRPIQENGGEENGQPSTPLELVTGSYDASNGEMTLYLNNTIVSTAQVPINCYTLYENASSFTDVGSVSNGSNNILPYIPGLSGDYFTGGAQLYSFNGAMGPTLVYNTSLTESESESIYGGNIPDPSNLVIVWTQNTAEYVYVNPGNDWCVKPDFNYGTTPTQIKNGPGAGAGSSGYWVPNLADLNKFDGLWGLAGAIPTSFAPFSDLVLWGGLTPLVLNPSILTRENINVTSIYSGLITPQKGGVYNLAINFTDPLPGATVERSVNTLEYANEYAKVYLNGQLVFEGSFVNQELHVIYSNNPTFAGNNLPEFTAPLYGPANLTVVYSFNLYGYNANNYPAIYLGLMWQPPNSPWFQYIPISNLKPFLV